MDPDATLQNIIDAAVAGEADELRYFANELAGWLDLGGFAPTALGEESR